MSSKAAGSIPAWAQAVRKASAFLGVVAAGLILLAIVVVCEMVFVRSVLGQSSIWQTEFATYSIVAATFLGAPYILVTRAHVNVDLVPLMSGPRVRRALYLLGSVIALFFCLAFLYASLSWWYEAWESNQTTASMWRARLWIPYLSVPVGLGLLCVQYLTEMWLVVSRSEHPFGLAPEDRI